MIGSSIHNSLIFILPTNCTSNRREDFLFVFNSFACTCRKIYCGAGLVENI